MTVLVEFLRRRRVDRRTQVASATYDEARRMLIDSKFTGTTETIWAEGVEKVIEIPNPVVIQLSR